MSGLLNIFGHLVFVTANLPRKGLDYSHVTEGCGFVEQHTVIEENCENTYLLSKMLLYVRVVAFIYQ